MYKGIGFDRTIHLAWLDAAAAYRLETDDPAILRQRLEPVVGAHLTGVDARRKTIDILLRLWSKSEALYPDLYAEALARARAITTPDDRLWLHYGLALLCYPFFRDCTLAIGQAARLEPVVTRRMIKDRLLAQHGRLGALERSVERTMASLADWGVLAPAAPRGSYALQRRAFAASLPGLEAWMLAAALRAHPAEELPFADLVRLPELMPFRFTLMVEDLRRDSRFAVHRQGMGIDMIRLEAVAT
jgi:hypothetical protein